MNELVRGCGFVVFRGCLKRDYKGSRRGWELCLVLSLECCEGRNKARRGEEDGESAKRESRVVVAVLTITLASSETPRLLDQSRLASTTHDDQPL